MNTNTDNQGKERVLKTLAIGGFVGLIIIIAWLGIQLISFMPSAFTSLASLADSVYNYKPVELVVVSNKPVANAGEAFSLSWNKPKQDGTFTFIYECVDGVQAEVRSASGAIESVNCDEAFTIGSTETMDISMSSERNRFTEIPYELAFTPIKASSPAVIHEGVITVVNAMISPVVVVATSTPVEVTPKPEVTVPKPEVVITTPKPTTPKPPAKPVFVQKPVYSIPVSNPNGITDIAVRSIGVGTVDSNNKFSLVGTINNKYKGAIQFEIKNIGTKTSNTFTYTANLPNGSVYTSNPQVALKPNERMIATISFDASGFTGIHMFNVSVNIAGDVNQTNNKFVSAVKISN